jgi:uncharacterized protein (TIGR02246 family)
MSATASTPADVIAVFGAAMREGRVQDALALYEPDAVFIAQPDGPPLTGREAISDALTQFAALRPTMSADIRKVVHAGDVATVLNTWQLHGTAADGTPVRMGATSADVMRRRPDGTWGILIDDPWGADEPDAAQ